MSIHELDTRPYLALAPLCRPGVRDTLLDRVCEVAHATPDATAVVADDGSVTFDELLHRIYAVARKIVLLSPDESRPLAVETTCTISTITLMFAVMASGRALVPLDPRLPASRRDNIVSQADAHLIDLDDVADAEDSAAPLPTITGSGIALIAFTSGSTGRAKGVLLSHRMCLSKAYEVGTTLGLTPGDRVGNALPISFGAGINTVFAAVLSGATAYCRDPRGSHTDTVMQWISRHGLTTLHCSPSLIRQLPSQSTDDTLCPLRIVTTYGEPLHARDVESFRASCRSEATIVNWYATTEAGGVAAHVLRTGDPLGDGFLPAGIPPGGKTVDIVRTDGHLAPRGEVGHVRVTADCFADGYLHLDDQTRARFTTDSGFRRYWTGDLGRIDDAGVLHLIGRLDDAVKIRGYQVEPAEVESALRSARGVTDAFVMAYTEESGPELVAFFVGADASEKRIRAVLRNTVPEWMVPKYLVAIDRIPRTDRGKVDRSALPARPGSVTTAPGAVPIGATESWLANIVARRLGCASVQRDVDFSELGATSLALTGILVDVRLAFHVDLTAADVVHAMTVTTLARVVDERHSELDRAKARSTVDRVLVPLRTDGAGTPLFVVAGAGVPAVGLAPLARRITERPVYALQARGLDARALPHRTIGGAARAYVRELRRVQPHGPYALAGHSLGAWIALEMAHILRRQGEEVDRVVLLDPRLFRWILDRLPGGHALEAAPPDPAAAMSRPSRFALVRQGWRVAAAGIVRFSTTERWLAFAIIGWMALRRHTPTPWDGPTTVVVTDSNVSDRASWEAVATGSLDMSAVPGPHVDMVREPTVELVAQVITRTLTRHA